jgi:peptidoglycan hydrolase-like protein with peptidoglycan-binding domain
MKWGLRQPVGLTDEGTQCPNHATDQQQVGELLDAVGLPAGGTPLETLPPIGEGFASPELSEAIRGFQQIQGLVADARVDVNGATWRRLIDLVDPGDAPPGGTPLLLAVSDFEVLELPRNASGLPSLTYTVRGRPVAVFEAPGIRAELSMNGPLQVAWGDAYPIACELAPDMAALEAAVASGVARTIGGVALDQLCSRLKVESRAAIGSMFAAITLRVGIDGAPIIGGSIGDEQGFTSLQFDPVERAVIYTATRNVERAQPVTGGEARVSGSVQLELKVTTTDGDSASVVAALVTVAAVGVVLFPVAEWAAGSELVSGLGAGVRELLVRLFRIPAP